MGFILRQSVKFTALNVFLIGIGALSIIFIYPNNLKLYGELNMLYFSANLITPVLSLGFSNVILKFHEKFKAAGLESSYISFSLYGATLTAFVGFVVYMLLEVWVINILNYFTIPVAFIKDNYFYIGALSFLLVINSSMIYYSSIQKRIVIPELLTNGGYKIFVPMLILTSVYLPLSTKQFFVITIAYFIVIFIMVLKYCISIKQNSWKPKFNIFSNLELFETVSFMFLSSVNNFFYHLIFKFDIIVVGIYLSPKTAGFYSILVFVISFLEIPNKSISQIATPLVSKYNAQANWKELSKLYTESSQNLFILGSFIYFIIIFNFEYLYFFIPKLRMDDINLLIVILLGLSRLIDMTFSLNSQIILFSKKFYIYNLFTVLVGLINCFGTQILVKNFGITGVVSSVLISILLFNFIKTIFIWASMGMNPVNRKIVFFSIFVFILHLVWYLAPKIQSPYIGILVNLILLVLLYVGYILKFKPSPIINDLICEIRDKQFLNKMLLKK